MVDRSPPYDSTARDLARDLRRFSPLDALHPDNLREISQKARVIRVAAGKYLFRSGEHTGHLFFLLAGTLELRSERGLEQTLEGGTATARSALQATSPGIRSARATTDVVAVAVDHDLLDMMLTWDQTGNYRVDDLDDNPADVDADWMTRLLQTECFRRIPPANIQRLFMRMEPREYNHDDVVIDQGDRGDSFYIIRDGHCEVTRSTSSHPQGIRLAELGPGDSFGEEALISDKERNATVTMSTPGTLMRISRDDFHALLNEPLLEWIEYDDAVALVGEGAEWIDVRLPAEFDRGHLPGSRNLPLLVLRMKAKQLDTQRTYIMVCDTGRRSSAASFLLNERGFDVRILSGGLAGTNCDHSETKR